MKCPICLDVDLTMADRLGIEIDYCPKCRGVWLDRGELDKIIERSTQSMAPTHPQYERPAPSHDNNRFVGHHGNDHHYDHGRPYHGKKSIWQELFD